MQPATKNFALCSLMIQDIFACSSFGSEIYQRNLLSAALLSYLPHLSVASCCAAYNGGETRTRDSEHTIGPSSWYMEIFFAMCVWSRGRTSAVFGV